MKTSRNTIALILATGLSAAAAHDGMHGPGARYDMDGDGGLSLAEYTVYATENGLADAARRFAELDRNKDGYLSESEFMRGLREAEG